MLSSGMWCHVVLVWTDILEEHITSTFRVEKSVSKEPPLWKPQIPHSVPLWGGYSLTHLTSQYAMNHTAVKTSNPTFKKKLKNIYVTLPVSIFIVYKAYLTTKNSFVALLSLVRLLKSFQKHYIQKVYKLFHNSRKSAPGDQTAIDQYEGTWRDTT